MNAISPFPVVGQDDATRSPNARWDPHRFRSQMLDKFAEIETWAVGRLRAAHPDKKLAPMLGLRFDAVRQLTETHAHLFKDAPAVAKLLDELRPLHDLRSTLAHAVLTIVSPTNGPRIALF